MEKLKPNSIKTYLYLLGTIVVLCSLLLTYLIQNLIGYFEFSKFYQAQFDNFWEQPHHAITIANYLSIVLIPIFTIIVIANIFFKKVIKQNLVKMEFILKNLTNNNLQFETPTSSLSEFQAIFETSNKIKEELANKLVFQWQVENTIKNQISIMKHEMNTPITIALGHLNLVKIYAEKQNCNDSISSEISIVQKSVERLKTHIDETLLLIEASSGDQHQTGMWSLNTLNTYINEVYPTVFSQKDKTFTIFYHVEKELDVNIYGNYTAIQHIIDNILSNSLKFSDKKTNITFSNDDSKKIVFFFSNDGPPFTPLELEHAFEKNFKNVTSSGSGIGLYFSKQLAKVNHASISIQNINGHPTTILTCSKI